MTAFKERLTLQRGVRHLKRISPWVASDAAITAASYFIIYSFRIETVPTDIDTRLGLFVLGAVFFTLAALYVFGGYHRIWAYTSGHDVKVIVAASGVVMGVTVAADLLLDPRPLPLSVVLVANLVAMMGFVAVRYQTRLISGLGWRWRAIWHQRFPEQDTRVLVIGAGDSGQITAWRLRHRAPNGQHYRVVGFIDDDPEKQNLYIESCQVLGTRTDIPRLAEAHKVDLIVVALHNIGGHDFRDILSYCESTNARIKIVPDVFALFDSSNSTPLLRDVQPEDLLGRKPIGWHEGIDVLPVKHKVVLVTGAAGSIGSELCRQILHHKPVKLILLDNNESGLHDLFKELAVDHDEAILHPVLADITNRAMLKRLFSEHRPQVVFHSAAYKHVPMLEYYPSEAIRVNIGGTQQVAGLARDFGVERFVLISTDKAVNPSSVMGASKRVCELLMHAFSQQGKHDTLFTSVRFGNVLGSRGSVVPIFNRQIDQGGPVTVTDPRMTRYFMTIPEAVNLVIHAACLTKGDDLFMLRMGEVVRIVDLAERMIRLRGLVPNKDILIEHVGVRPGEKLHEELHSDVEEETPTLHPHIVELKHSHNGLQPVSFLDRLDRLVHHGLVSDDLPLDQLHAVIALGENMHALEVTY